MVLAAATYRRPSSEAPAMAAGMMPSPDHHMDLHLSSHEQKEHLAAALPVPAAAAHHGPDTLPELTEEQVELRMTPRELRERRRRSIRSCMEVIESSMTSDDWTRLKRLAKQGAVHYQAEEEFMFAPMMRRSQSAPNSSLAERYERLRSCTSPNTFRRPGHLSASADAQTQAANVQPNAPVLPGAAQSETTTQQTPLGVDVVSGQSSALNTAAAPASVGESAGGAATVPRRTSRAPTRILVRSADAPALLAMPTSPTAPMSPAAGVLSETDSARAPSPPALHATDASMTDDSRASMDCLDSPTIALPRTKRGSDPHVDVEEEEEETKGTETKKKKKHRGLFHRRRRYTESESAEESSSASPVRDRSWTQRVQHYMQNLLRRR